MKPPTFAAVGVIIPHTSWPARAQRAWPDVRRLGLTHTMRRCGIENPRGRFFCIRCGAMFASNFEAHSHSMRGHSLAWMCECGDAEGF